MPPPNKKAFQYFKVDLTKTSYGLFCLRVYRLIKKKEAQQIGYAPRDQYKFCAELQNMSERDAQCIVMALESKRPTLKPDMEVKHWAKKTKHL
jgi:hypothetical protein